MKTSIVATVLAATAAIAAPTVAKRDGQFVISDLKARTSLSRTMSFTLLDTSAPGGEVTTDCNMIWPANSAPNQNARCNGGQYLIQFPDGFPGIGHFTLALERIGADPIGGRAYLDENDGKWQCVENPEPHVKKDCKYDGSYTIPL
ncbi:hypothetical protein BDV26DRAFT_197769 [Aspergillus bertholletiae]|uniref:AA1-like domain-containing protein n=1 Tax=Aspergillus bertholletiae TaxID=1226010 RepID=A0A5N7B8S4_9EURO|nr:hypothetical protein BDV26DRAFT_197769 [Aspergillus bertholletiae]